MYVDCLDITLASEKNVVNRRDVYLKTARLAQDQVKDKGGAA